MQQGRSNVGTTDRSCWGPRHHASRKEHHKRGNRQPLLRATACNTARRAPQSTAPGVYGMQHGRSDVGVARGTTDNNRCIRHSQSTTMTSVVRRHCLVPISSVSTQQRDVNHRWCIDWDTFTGRESSTPTEMRRSSDTSRKCRARRHHC
jgi:hypothetical protein